MSIGDVAFLLGPVGAFLLIPAASVLIVAGRRPRWAMWTAVGLAPIATVSWLVYWVSWGKSFEYANSYQPVPDWLRSIGGASMGLCAVAASALTLVAITSLPSERPSAEAAV